MAKTRAQRKAERRAREAEQGKRGDGRDREAEAQHETQIGVSGEVAEVEAVEAGIAAGAPEADLETPDAPGPSRSERRAEAKAAKQAERKRRDDQRQRESQELARKEKQAAAKRGREPGGARGGVIGFIISCWAELKKVQWPNRETLIQATAVTVIFVAVAAAYLGALDALFNFLVKQIL